MVMIGILLVLQVNNWNIERSNKTEEAKILRGMQVTLSSDLIEFKSTLQWAIKSEIRINSLQEIMSSGVQVDSLDFLFGSVYGIHSFDLYSSSYEVLKSNRLNLIKDDSIRQLIVTIYDTHLKNILGFNAIENNVNFDVLRPYYLNNFSNIRSLNNATPKDVDKILSDDYFQNIVDYRFTVLRSNILRYHPNVVQDIEKLLNRIDNYLNG
ncbi:MAG: hypothetical protein P8M34_15740 [Saprospiraceae bacterium]|nr:hypothetical protein [Saprospiraceae bacterium]